MRFALKRLLALWGAVVLFGPILAVAQQDPVDKDDDDDEDEMEEEDDPGARWEYFYDQRSFPNDLIPRGARLEAFRRIKAMEDAIRTGKAPRRAAAAESPWKLIGPAPIQYTSTLTTSGRVNSIAIDPRDKNVVYLAAADGGVWKTTDGGLNWKPLTDDQASLASGAVAIDPSNPDTIYVGTGELSFAIDRYLGAGILKSTDGGATWTNIVGPFLNDRVGAISVHPTDGKTVLVSAGTGLYRSTDAGETWRLVLPGTSISNFFDPTRQNVAWAGMGSPSSLSTSGVFRSTDNGATWARVSGAGSTALPGTILFGRVEIVPSLNSPDTVYASIGDATDASTSLLGIYKTTDAGQSWTKLTAPDFCTPQCWYDMVIRPHPTDPNIIYAGGIAMYRTMNGGQSWQSITNSAILHPDQHALQFTPDGQRLYVGNDGGMWSTEAISAPTPTWSSLNDTLSLTQYYPNISIHPTDPNIGLGGTQDNGTHIYAGRLRWNMAVGGDGGWTAIDPTVPNTRYGAFTGASVYRTLRGDFSDQLTVTNGIATSDRIRFIAPYVMDPTNPQTMYFGTNKLYKSIDGGGSWRAISPDVTKPPTATTTSTTYAISTIAVAPTNPSVIYTGSISAAFFATVDGGATWQDRSLGLPNRSITHVTADPFDPLTVYVTVSGFAGPAEAIAGHVYKSADAGATWIDIGTTLPNLPVQDLVVDPDLANTIYIGTDLGVMATYDGGASWATLGNGLPRTSVVALALHRPSRTLRAGTHGRSTWDYPLGAVTTGARPIIESLTPSTKNAGDGTFELKITGSGFAQNAHVFWNGAERTVTSSSNNSLSVQIPASDLANVGRAAITVFNPTSGGGSSIPMNFVIGPGPKIADGGIVGSANPASASASPGTLMSLYGSGLASGLAQFVTFPLPPTLGQVTLTINGGVVPLYFVSPGQINFQVPYTGLVAGRTYSVVANFNGQNSGSATIVMNTVSPGLFALNQRGSGQGAIRIANSATVAAPTGSLADARPVKPGEAIEIYCTGLGTLSPAVSTGSLPSRLASTVLAPTVTVGGVEARVLFSGLNPGAAGLYQVNVVIPDTAAAGDAVPVELTIGGVKSNTVTVAIGAAQ